MDSRGEETRHGRGMRDRVFQWAGRKFNQISESDSEPSSSSITSHQNEPSRRGSSHGQHPILPQQSDHLHLLFKASPLPVLGTITNTSHAAYSPNKSYPPNISVSCVDFLGDVHSTTTYVKRDLGFQGQIGSFVLLSYGDTMYSDANYSDKWRGMTSDSVALATHDPLVVVDPVLNQHGYPPQFCPIIDSFGEDPSECALGITNVVQTTTSDDGVMFFLLNHRPDGKNNLVGAGVATVHLDTSRYPPAPHIQRLARFWWDASQEPWYGDVCALRHDGYVYAYGHGGHADQNPWVYVARARLEEATNLECYEYWNGESWQQERLMTKDLSEKESVFWQINQGQVVWNEYLGCFIFVYCDNWMNSKVLMKTAQKPEGPWSNEAVELYQATPASDGGAIYAAIPHDYYDRDGRTLVVTFTNHPNTIQAVKVTFG